MENSQKQITLPEGQTLYYYGKEPVAIGIRMDIHQPHMVKRNTSIVSEWAPEWPPFQTVSDAAQYLQLYCNNPKKTWDYAYLIDYSRKKPTLYYLGALEWGEDQWYEDLFGVTADELNFVHVKSWKKLIGLKKRFSQMLAKPLHLLLMSRLHKTNKWLLRGGMLFFLWGLLPWLATTFNGWGWTLQFLTTTVFWVISFIAFYLVFNPARLTYPIHEWWLTRMKTEGIFYPEGGILKEPNKKMAYIYALLRFVRLHPESRSAANQIFKEGQIREQQTAMMKEMVEQMFGGIGFMHQEYNEGW